MYKSIRFLSVISVIFSLTLNLSASEDEYSGYITTAVPFLTISPDAISGGMGDSGAATAPDEFSQYWNSSKYSFTQNRGGVAFSFVPWLKELTSDINLVYLSGYRKLTSNYGISGSMRYFSYGNIKITDQAGNYTSSINPNELALDASYYMNLSPSWSGSVTLRYIRSDLYSGSIEGYKAGNAVAADLSFFHHKALETLNPSSYSFGAIVSNIGSKISYNGGETDEFLPANLKLGGAYLTSFDDINSIQFSLDINKLLVPSSQIANGATPNSSNQNNTSSVEAIFNSFSDAAGGASEELQEVGLSIGSEYIYDNMLFIRGGYRYEHKDKGNRNYLTLGLGLAWKDAKFNFAYLIPTKNNNSLTNSMKVSLSYRFTDK